MATRLLLIPTGVALLLALSTGSAPAQQTSQTPSTPQSPQATFGELFKAVQESSLYPDSKTFPDAQPLEPPARILAEYRARVPLKPDALREFIAARFRAPAAGAPVAVPRAGLALGAHIDALWDVLTRRSAAVPAYSSLLPVPQPYVVPGGRFRELYYWDSYFVMLGLSASGRSALLGGMVEDFAHLIDTYGHVPNGTRSYYLSRSQPPFFYAMVGLLSPATPARSYGRYLRALRQEHAFWMHGAGQLTPGTARDRVVSMADGSILNRYWDDSDLPRDESYREDTRLALGSGRDPAQLYRELRAGAESGWDYSSRWFVDQRTRATIHVTAIVPVDLNSLLYGLERAIANGCAQTRDQGCAAEFSAHAAARKAAVDRYLWDRDAGIYRDYDWTALRQLPVESAATFYPLFTELADQDQAAAVAATAERDLLAAGGIVTTRNATGEQWDAPNGWPPLQWVAIAGLRNYQLDALAARIACRWLDTVGRSYRETGKLFEKYDVVDAHSGGGGGGEYPLQDGFGWTNGVTRQLMKLYPAQAAALHVP